MVCDAPAYTLFDREGEKLIEFSKGTRKRFSAICAVCVSMTTCPHLKLPNIDANFEIPQPNEPIREGYKTRQECILGYTAFRGQYKEYVCESNGNWKITGEEIDCQRQSITFEFIFNLYLSRFMIYF